MGLKDVLCKPDWACNLWFPRCTKNCSSILSVAFWNATVSHCSSVNRGKTYFCMSRTIWHNICMFIELQMWGCDTFWLLYKDKLANNPWSDFCSSFIIAGCLIICPFAQYFRIVSLQTAFGNPTLYFITQNLANVHFIFEMKNSPMDIHYKTENAPPRPPRELIKKHQPLVFQSVGCQLDVSQNALL